MPHAPDVRIPPIRPIAVDRRAEDPPANRIERRVGGGAEQVHARTGMVTGMGCGGSRVVLAAVFWIMGDLA